MTPGQPPPGDLVHAVANPKLKDKFSANGRAFWSIDEGWDSFWCNRDDTVFIEGTGTHLWVHDQHPKFRRYGTGTCSTARTGSS